MPDTKTQAEGTPCSLVLQPNSKIGVGIYIWKNSEHNLRCVYYRICLERGWVFHLPNTVNVYLRVSTMAANAGMVMHHNDVHPVIKLLTKRRQ